MVLKARADMSRELLTSFNELFDIALADPAVAELLFALTAADAELTPVETIQVYNLAHRWFNSFNAVHDAYAEGLVPSEVYDDYASGVASFMSTYPGINSLMALAVRRGAQTEPPG